MSQGGGGAESPQQDCVEWLLLISPVSRCSSWDSLEGLAGWGWGWLGPSSPQWACQSLGKNAPH